MAEKPLGLGIIGLHHQHPRWYFPLWAHLPQYQPLAISDADEEFLEEGKKFFQLDGYTDYRRILERDDIDVVIIFLPHSQMPEAVELAAAAGKAVLVEKPCAADVAGGQRIVAAAARFPKIKISSPYCWRTHPMSARIREALDKGLLGRMITLEGRLNAGGAYRYVRDHATWMLEASEGGGPMWNLGVHWIDYFRAMTGQEIVSVSGVVCGPFGAPRRSIEDSAQALLTLSDGATAVLDISYSMTDSYPGKRDIFVSFRGSSGSMAWAPAWEGLTDELLLVSEKVATANERCQRIQVTSRSIPGYCGHMAWTFLADFAAAVREDRDPLVSPADILANLKVVDAFHRSVASGQRELVSAQPSPVGGRR